MSGHSTAGIGCKAEVIGFNCKQLNHSLLFVEDILHANSDEFIKPSNGCYVIESLESHGRNLSFIILNDIKDIAVVKLAKSAEPSVVAYRLLVLLAKKVGE